MDRPGVRQVPDGNGEQGKMEKTGCGIICGAPTTLAAKGLMRDERNPKAKAGRLPFTNTGQIGKRVMTSNITSGIAANWTQVDLVPMINKVCLLERQNTSFPNVCLVLV